MDSLIALVLFYQEHIYEFKNQLLQRYVQLTINQYFYLILAMEKTKNQRPLDPFFTIKTKLKIPSFFWDQVIYLTNNKAAFLRDQLLTILDLNPERGEKQIDLPIHRRLNGWEQNAISLQNLTPLGELIAFSEQRNMESYDEGYIYVYDQKGLKHYHNYMKSSRVRFNTFYFFQTGKLYAKQALSCQTKIVDLNQNKEVFRNDKQIDISTKADDQNLIVLSANQNSLVILNLQTKETIIKEIPFQCPKFISFISQNQMLYIQKKSLNLLTLGVEHSKENLIQFNQFDNVLLIRVNIRLSLVLIGLKNNFSYTQKKKEADKIIIYNFIKKGVVFSGEESEVNTIGLRMSPNLDTYISASGADTIVHRVISRKKGLMNIFKKSYLAERYGDSLMRYILRVY